MGTIHGVAKESDTTQRAHSSHSGEETCSDRHRFFGAWFTRCVAQNIARLGKQTL